METQTELVPYKKPPLFTYQEAKDFAVVAAESKMFLSIGVVNSSKALAIILMGREMGLGLAASLKNIWIGENGIPNLYSRALASLIKNSGEYDYETLQWDDKAAEIQFLRGHSGKWEKLSPTSRFTLEDATKAGLTSKKGSAWDKYRKNMLWARALSNGFGIHCPHLANGMPVYAVAEEEPRVEYREPLQVTQNAPGTPARGVPAQLPPEAEFESANASQEAQEGITEEEYNQFHGLAAQKGSSLEAIRQHHKITDLRKMSKPMWVSIMRVLESKC